MMNFRKLIRSELTRRNMPQAELGRRANLTPARVSDYLGGHRDVKGETLQRMFSALDFQIKPAAKPGKER